MANIITELHLEMSDNWYVTKKLNSVGRVGENTVTKLIIEPTEILDNVTYEIEIMSADGSKNVAELTVDEDVLYLILTANMLTTSGIMKMQVRGLFTDGSIKKSNIFELKVNRSISATEHYEEYAVTIFDQLVQDCRDIIEGAESYVVRAETAAVNAETYEQSASASAEGASASATTAATSATAASNSATSATTAASNAATSETNAASSAASASTSAANANTSATNAANSASAAATSATNAHNSEVNASTSETNASTSATEAAASAESIAASVAQINENTYRINDLEAIIAGYQQADLPTGAVASITDGTALLMPSLKIGIEPVQDLHGYEHPWAGGAGKNKCDLSAFTHTGFSNDTGTESTLSYRLFSAHIPVESDATYTLSLLGSKNGENIYINRIIYFDSNNTFIERQIIGYSQTESFTSLSNAKYVQIDLKTTSNLDIEITDVSNIQLEEGSTATSYEPYSNICPISGWTAANVNVSPTTSAEDGTTYTIQFRDGDNPLAIYGGTLDVTSGELVVDRAMDIITKDSTWYSFVTGTGNSSAMIQLTNYSNVKYVDGISSYNGGITSTGLEAPNYWTTARQDEIPSQGDMCFAYNNTGQLRFHRTDVVNITDLTSFVANFPDTQVCYKLATPITYQLTPTQIRTLVGTNNIWADTGNIIEGKYFKSLT